MRIARVRSIGKRYFLKLKSLDTPRRVTLSSPSRSEGVSKGVLGVATRDDTANAIITIPKCPPNTASALRGIPPTVQIKNSKAFANVPIGNPSAHSSDLVRFSLAMAATSHLPSTVRRTATPEKKRRVIMDSRRSGTRPFHQQTL